MEPKKNNFKIVSDKKARIILPNAITLIGVCIGLTSIKFAIDGKFAIAIIAILFASELFESVSCFCFDFFQKSKEHYYEKLNVDLNATHNHMNEYKMSRELPNVKFYPD